MNERTHPSEDLLAGFATGDLRIAPSLAVAAHLETCAGCRRRIGAFEEAEGRLLASLPPAPMSPRALDRVMARIDAAPDLTPETEADEQQLADIYIPQAVSRLGLGPRRWMAPGLWAAPVRAPREEDWRTFLLRAPAGTTIPTHGHRGGELIAVLSGAFEDGRTYRAGDFAENVADSDHHLRITPDGPCACLISMQGRVQWRGWARMITPLLGI